VADGTTLRRVTPAGVVSTLAGQLPAPQVQAHGGTMDLGSSYGGMADGRGAAAQVSATQLAVGPDGMVYFTDSNTVRRLSPDGQVTTLAGLPGTDPGSHRDGPGAQARFDMPAGLAVAPDGTVYVADMGNNVIRCISPAGVVSTLAGQPGEYGGVNGTGAAARFDHPKALAWAPDGALLVHDAANDCIRRVTRRGEVTTWLGTIRNTRRGPEPGADLDLSSLESFVVDAAGTLYFTTRSVGEDHIVRRILPDRSEPVRPWAGQADARAYADAPTPGAARFNFPNGLALGPTGTLYVADVQNRVIRAISPTGRVTTLAGQPPLASLDGQGPAATLPRPTSLALEPGGSLLVISEGQLRRVSAAGQVTTVAGTYPPPSPPDDGPTSLQNPYGVAVVGSTAFVSDEARHVIYQVASHNQLRRWAGRPDTPGDNDDGGLGRALFDQPTALAAAPDGTLYVCDREGYAVRLISPKGKVSTLAGQRKAPVSPLSNEGRYVSSSAVAVGPDGAVYVLQGSLRRYPPGGGAPVVLAGSDDNEPGYTDGRGAAARFNSPTGLCVAADGTVYVADRGNHLIRRVSPAGDVTTVAGQPGVHPLRAGAGQGVYKYAPDGSGSMDFTALGDYHDGPAASARFNHPAAVALGPDGTLYVADEDNNCIRTIRPAPAAERP
jgi:sugar lactone lactonase YvrE